MNRIILGAVSALLLAASGLFWWQGRAATEASAPPMPPPVEEPSGEAAPGDEIPDEDGEGLIGSSLPAVNPATREEKRFNRLDKNRDNLIQRNEMLAARVAAFRKLDADRNNLLSFEEWSVATSNRFKKADANGDQQLTRPEFATTKPKAPAKPACKC